MCHVCKYTGTQTLEKEKKENNREEQQNKMMAQMPAQLEIQVANARLKALQQKKNSNTRFMIGLRHNPLIQ